MIELTEALLAKKWDPVEFALLKRMIGNLISYKHFIPNVIKNDIVDILTIANKIKSEYDILSAERASGQDALVNGEDAENQTDAHARTDINTQTESYTQVFTIVSRLQLENDSIILNESNIFENKLRPNMVQTVPDIPAPVSVSASATTPTPPLTPKKKKKRNIFQKIFFIE
jgi:hypothetical protein